MDLPPELHALIRNARVARLATVDPQSRPHVVPVCFAIDGDTAYIPLDEKPKRVPAGRLKRVRNLLSNPEVQLLIDHYEEDWSRLAYVQLRGHAAIIEPGEEHTQALSLLRAKYQRYRAMPLEDAPVIRIEAYRVVTWNATSA